MSAPHRTSWPLSACSEVALLFRLRAATLHANAVHQLGDADVAQHCVFKLALQHADFANDVLPVQLCERTGAAVRVQNAASCWRLVITAEHAAAGLSFCGHAILRLHCDETDAASSGAARQHAGELRAMQLAVPPSPDVMLPTASLLPPLQPCVVPVQLFPNWPAPQEALGTMISMQLEIGARALPFSDVPASLNPAASVTALVSQQLFAGRDAELCIQALPHVATGEAGMSSSLGDAPGPLSLQAPPPLAPLALAAREALHDPLVVLAYAAAGDGPSSYGRPAARALQHGKQPTQVVRLGVVGRLGSAGLWAALPASPGVSVPIPAQLVNDPLAHIVFLLVREATPVSGSVAAPPLAEVVAFAFVMLRPAPGCVLPDAEFQLMVHGGMPANVPRDAVGRQSFTLAPGAVLAPPVPSDLTPACARALQWSAPLPPYLTAAHAEPAPGSASLRALPQPAHALPLGGTLRVRLALLWVHGCKHRELADLLALAVRPAHAPAWLLLHGRHAALTCKPAELLHVRHALCRAFSAAFDSIMARHRAIEVRATALHGFTAESDAAAATAPADGDGSSPAAASADAARLQERERQRQLGVLFGVAAECLARMMLHPAACDPDVQHAVAQAMARELSPAFTHELVAWLHDTVNALAQQPLAVLEGAASPAGVGAGAGVGVEPSGDPLALDSGAAWLGFDGTPGFLGVAGVAEGDVDLGLDHRLMTQPSAQLARTVALWARVVTLLASRMDLGAHALELPPTTPSTGTDGASTVAAPDAFTAGSVASASVRRVGGAGRRASAALTLSRSAAGAADGTRGSPASAAPLRRASGVMLPSSRDASAARTKATSRWGSHDVEPLGLASWASALPQGEEAAGWCFLTSRMLAALAAPVMPAELHAALRAPRAVLLPVSQWPAALNLLRCAPRVGPLPPLLAGTFSTPLPHSVAARITALHALSRVFPTCLQLMPPAAVAAHLGTLLRSVCAALYAADSSSAMPPRVPPTPAQRAGETAAAMLLEAAAVSLCTHVLCAMPPDGVTEADMRPARMAVLPVALQFLRHAALRGLGAARCTARRAAEVPAAVQLLTPQAQDLCTALCEVTLPALVHAAHADVPLPNVGTAGDNEVSAPRALTLLIQQAMTVLCLLTKAEFEGNASSVHGESGLPLAHGQLRNFLRSLASGSAALLRAALLDCPASGEDPVAVSCVVVDAVVLLWHGLLGHDCESLAATPPLSDAHPEPGGSAARALQGLATCLADSVAVVSALGAFSFGLGCRSAAVGAAGAGLHAGAAHAASAAAVRAVVALLSASAHPGFASAAIAADAEAIAATGTAGVEGVDQPALAHALQTAACDAMLAATPSTGGVGPRLSGARPLSADDCASLREGAHALLDAFSWCEATLVALAGASPQGGIASRDVGSVIAGALARIVDTCMALYSRQVVVLSPLVARASPLAVLPTSVTMTLLSRCAVAAAAADAAAALPASVLLSDVLGEQQTCAPTGLTLTGLAAQQHDDQQCDAQQATTASDAATAELLVVHWAQGHAASRPGCVSTPGTMVARCMGWAVAAAAAAGAQRIPADAQAGHGRAAHARRLAPYATAPSPISVARRVRAAISAASSVLLPSHAAVCDQDGVGIAECGPHRMDARAPASAPHAGAIALFPVFGSVACSTQAQHADGDPEEHAGTAPTVWLPVTLKDPFAASCPTPTSLAAAELATACIHAWLRDASVAACDATAALGGGAR